MYENGKKNGYREFDHGGTSVKTTLNSKAKSKNV